MQSFVSIDFETANENRGSACSVGLIRYVDGVEQESFTTLLRPIEELNYFSWRNINVHGITPDDVVGAPEWSEVDGEIRDLIGTSRSLLTTWPSTGMSSATWPGCMGFPRWTTGGSAPCALPERSWPRSRRSVSTSCLGTTFRTKRSNTMRHWPMRGRAA